MTDPSAPRSDEALSRAIERFAGTRHEHARDWSSPDAATTRKLDAVAAFWQELDGLADDPAMADVLADARLALAPARPRRLWRGAGLVACAAVAVLAVIVVKVERDGGFALPGVAPADAPAAPRLLANGIAPPRTIRLDDGTQVILDARSSVTMASWTPRERVLDLTSGRAYFDVAHNAARPFKVRVGKTSVTDIGTRFEIAARPQGAVVTLIQGQARVQMAASPRAIDLTPGMRLDVTGDTWTLAQHVAAPASEWPSGVVHFDDAPLPQVVAELNRYLPDPLVIKAGADRSQRISGVFRLDDPEGLVNALSIMTQGHVEQRRTPAGG